jgi:hypothetical protein
MTILASLLVAAATLSSGTDYSATCLTELKLATIPTKNPTHLYLYRRCLNTKTSAAEHNEAVERRLQRLDQYFWRDKEVGEEQKTAQEAQLKKDIRWNQKKRSAQQTHVKTRLEALQSSRNKVRAQVRLLERERDAKGEAK